MDWEIVWTPPALDGLHALFAFHAQHSETAADRTVNAILERVELLRTVPLMGAVYPRDSQGPNRFVVSGKYRIFYRVRDEAKLVEILTVWHSSRRDPELPS